MDATGPTAIKIRETTFDDYPAALALWKGSEGVGLSSADTPEAICRYLQRNAGLSFVAFDGDELVGAVLCGHDGRRGYLHHMAVSPAYRRRGLGRDLASRCLEALKREGIDKCHLFVYAKNEPARAFWSQLGWYERGELVLMSIDV